ncbi:MAG: fatty acyl-AMP ligase [Myxococcales bacterium]|nr:fatty acyl-AMP ligase [Myxococcales bacterium]
MAEPQSLLDCLEALPPSTDRGLRFIDAQGGEHFFAWPELTREAKRRAYALRQKGLRQGDRLALIVPEGHDFVLSFLGAMAAGIVPVPIFPRATFKAIDTYHDTVAHTLRASQATMLLSTLAMKPYLEAVLSRDVPVARIETIEEVYASLGPELNCPQLHSNDLCFLQFTSGSTSQPKGVMVTHGNLIANARAFLGPKGLDRRSDDIGVSWLPLYHDMGLIGFILGVLVMDIPVIILPTASFARNPRLWLDTIRKHKGTLTFAPNFAYTLVVKRLHRDSLDGWDLSHLRVAGCGAEPINPHTMRAFTERLAPVGFRPEAILPTYGMAEATLAITFADHAASMKTDIVDAQALQQGVAIPAERSTQTPVELVCCGKPFPGHELCIWDDAGTPLKERMVGEIVVRGPSVTQGYYNNAEATQAAWRDGWLLTGDLGYLADGELYICGRSKDLIIINGANHYPQDLEWLVDTLPGVRRNNVVAFSSIVDGEEKLVLIAEGASGDAQSLRSTIASTITQSTGLAVHEVGVVPAGSLPKTSSGKVQRRKTKQLYEERALALHP